jgi:hypothetical protein
MQLGRAFRATNGSRVLFDQLVGLSEQRGRHGEAERIRGRGAAQSRSPAESRFDPPNCLGCSGALKAFRNKAK